MEQCTGLGSRGPSRIKQANAGYKVILSCVSNLYFDMASEKAFDEPGYYWGGYVDVDKLFKFYPIQLL